MSLDKLLDTELGGLVFSAGKGLLIGGFAAGVAYIGLSARVDNIEQNKANAEDVAVLIEREQLHHNEVMRRLERIETKLDGKADKP